MSYEAHLAEGTIAIFLFHGVTEHLDSTVRNYTRKHLPHDYFASVIRRLKQHGSAVSLEEIRLHHEEGLRLPPRPFAITFDDGFRNNLTLAAPVLADESVPKSVIRQEPFLSTYPYCPASSCILRLARRVLGQNPDKKGDPGAGPYRLVTVDEVPEGV